MTLTWIPDADRLSPWPQAKVVVAGLGVSGFAAADGLLSLGARVCVLDESDASADKGTLLEMLDAEVRLGSGSTALLPQDCDLLATSPGWRPSAPLLAQAEARGIPIWGETELAWRMMHPDRVIPWLGITGTNGKTTTTQMTESILRAAGLRATAVGNIGRPIVEAVLDERGYDVLAVELSSFQLHYQHTVQLHSAVVLNLHDDHLEWYADHGGFDVYAADKERVYRGCRHAAIYNVAEPVTEHMVERADVTEGCRAIGFTLGIPAMSMVGVVDDLIVDRAFVEQRKTSALELAKVADVQPYAPHNVENALAAAALTRSFGVRAADVAAGLQTLELAGHRIQQIAEADGVRWVDDSKATNPHAANSSMKAFDSIVWIAGGQAKGTSFDDLVATHAAKLKAAILLGQDRHQIADAISQHAPEVPLIIVDDTDDEAMTVVVHHAAHFARPGDVVLLAPGCASLDMFSSYGERGDRFASAVRALLQRRNADGQPDAGAIV